MIPGEVVVYVRHAVRGRGGVRAYQRVVIGGPERARGVTVDEICAVFS